MRFAFEYKMPACNNKKSREGDKVSGLTFEIQYREPVAVFMQAQIVVKKFHVMQYVKLYEIMHIKRNVVPFKLATEV